MDNVQAPRGPGGTGRGAHPADDPGNASGGGLAMNALHVACAQSDLGAAVRLLEAKADANLVAIACGDGSLSLRYHGGTGSVAVHDGTLPVAMEVAARIADAESCFCSALHLAILRKDARLVTALIASGAKVDSVIGRYICCTLFVSCSMLHVGRWLHRLLQRLDAGHARRKHGRLRAAYGA